jgi:predicted dehydrogenase
MLGRISRIDCSFYRGPRFGGFRDAMPSPLLGDMSIHHFDLARHLSGADPVSVYAAEQDPAGSWYTGAAAASAIFELSEGVVFSYAGSWAAEGLATPWAGEWRIVGERGTITLRGDEVQAELVGDDGSAVPADVPPAVLEHETQRESLRQMLTALRGGPVPVTECHDNIRSLAMVHAAIRSAALGRRVAVRRS